jgi:hypothetical protein
MPSKNMVDKMKHDTDIEKVTKINSQIMYFEKPKCLLIIEKDSPYFKIYNP